jgi:hypothetical protein
MSKFACMAFFPYRQIAAYMRGQERVENFFLTKAAWKDKGLLHVYKVRIRSSW